MACLLTVRHARASISCLATNVQAIRVCKITCMCACRTSNITSRRSESQQPCVPVQLNNLSKHTNKTHGCSCACRYLLELLGDLTQNMAITRVHGSSPGTAISVSGLTCRLFVQLPTHITSQQLDTFDATETVENLERPDTSQLASQHFQT